MADLRQQGVEWAEIAQQLGDSPVNLRKRFSRAMDRISQELGLNEAGE